ncbi:hypothetical protein CLAFUW4_12172 [Fulvia fulva]|uniref:2EXR domain-containing protein n=1 Tax=Passalora fulva TaxID=5499 RepID=A0A9Q8USH3_PASFU|nr:uncharacterized protein CLAFUR5_11209 [Fulvia fulva]KAK4617895.1 hypothetical protein CLAFUR4_12177 [Fulvia fulva]KAK4619093.1 hypothetical protein CLAFUR0_12188 [Fulvia fulva]UJO20798.1 hypothetical protein CLAFUR5_11209 [Fulvia fulva]WPV17836.1 hypothetical protein CLAFUW4_12172 [Fulvia fulva]WPV32926.1 hypothetical protein CLAFUW7_12179 [Fulvia fulva]
MDSLIAELTKSFAGLTLTSPNKQKTSFLELPQELRDMIYEFAYSGREIIDRGDVDHKGTHVARPGRKVTSYPAALLTVSKQIRLEASPYYYKLCTFHFEGRDATYYCFAFIKALEPQYRNLLQDVRVHSHGQVPSGYDPFIHSSIGFIDGHKLRSVQWHWRHLQDCIRNASILIAKDVLKTRLEIVSWDHEQIRDFWCSDPTIAGLGCTRFERGYDQYKGLD